MAELEDVSTILLCDETKFYRKRGDAENAIYYFAIALKKEQVSIVNQQFQSILESFRIKADIFHSTEIFRNKRPREKLMSAITNVIISNSLPCFCFKYNEDLLFEPTRRLKYLNDGEIIDFEKNEFQALFYFITCLNTYLRDEKPRLLAPRSYMFFDRNVYGKWEIEGFNFSREDFLIKGMTFVENEKLPQLALPDFWGYIFRKSKISFNKAQLGDTSLETDILTVNSIASVLRIQNSGLFNFIDMDKYIDAIEYILGLSTKFTAK